MYGKHVKNSEKNIKIEFILHSFFIYNYTDTCMINLFNA